MPRSPRLPVAATVLSLLVTASLVHASQPAGGPSLAATAGFDGVVRAGRWTPVRVTLANDGPEIAGDLVVEAGPNRTVRPVALASPSRKSLEIYVRADTADLSSIRVTLDVPGGPSVVVPVRTVGAYAGLTVCVATAGMDPGGNCGAAVAPQQAPLSWRGYDGADEVTVAGNAVLDERRTLALSRWRMRQAARDWIPPAMAPSEPPGTALAARAVVPGYAAVLVLAWVAARRLSRSPLLLYMCMAAVAVAGSVAVAAQGRLGPGSTVTSTERVILRMMSGGDGALVQAQGTVRFPAHAAYAVAAPFADGVIVRRGSSADAADEAGRSVVAATFGKGDILEYEMEGFADVTTLAVERGPAALRITNVSDLSLSGCSLPPGLSPRAIGRLEPGSSVSVSGTLDPLEHAMTCAAAGKLPVVDIRGHAMSHDTRAVLIFDLDPGSTP